MAARAQVLQPWGIGETWRSGLSPTEFTPLTPGELALEADKFPEGVSETERQLMVNLYQACCGEDWTG